jgi:hypothetical protein
MTDEEFDARVQAIEQGHAQRCKAADAWRDQEFARLFNECEWIQDKIASKIGRTQQWVSLRLIFGRFLSFIAPRNSEGIRTDRISERAFRKLYSGTRGGKRERFASLLSELKENLPRASQLCDRGRYESSTFLNVRNDGA